MASLRIKFPEKDETSVIVLTGERITVGRLPENTIQIVDRVVSSTHAEFLLEGDHFHLRDLDSTNGTFVDGQFVTDFHLRAPCKIAFGTVECEFDPAATAAEGAAMEALPTRAELTALKKENETLTAQVASLREEVEALRKVRPMSGEEATLAVPKSEYERVTADREVLKEAQERHHQEIARLKENLALLRRDRENLQRAWEITKAELTAYRPVAPAAAPKPAPLKAVPVANPPMARTPGVPPAAPSAPSLPTTQQVTPAVANATTVKAIPRAAAPVPQPARSTQKMDPAAAATPKSLPKPSVKLGSGINRPVPKVVAKPPTPAPTSSGDSTAS